MASSRAKVLRSTRARWKPMPASIAAKRLMSSDQRAAPEAAVAEYLAALEAEAGSQDETERGDGDGSDAGRERLTSSIVWSTLSCRRCILPGDPHALLTCSALTVVATMLGDAGQRYSRRAAIPGRG